MYFLSSYVLDGKWYVFPRQLCVEVNSKGVTISVCPQKNPGTPQEISKDHFSDSWPVPPVVGATFESAFKDALQKKPHPYWDVTPENLQGPGAFEYMQHVSHYDVGGWDYTTLMRRHDGMWGFTPKFGAAPVLVPAEDISEDMSNVNAVWVPPNRQYPYGAILGLQEPRRGAQIYWAPEHVARAAIGECLIQGIRVIHLEHAAPPWAHLYTKSS